jgi:hypothetical protein
MMVGEDTLRDLLHGNLMDVCDGAGDRPAPLSKRKEERMLYLALNGEAESSSNSCINGPSGSATVSGAVAKIC